MLELQFHFFLQDARNGSRMHGVIACVVENFAQADNHHLHLASE